MILPAVRSAFIATILLSLLTLGAMRIGPNLPPSGFAQYFHSCSGIPCYLDVVPGKTSWNDAVAIFKGDPGMQFDPNTNTAANPPGFQGTALIYASDHNATVDEIDLTIHSTNVSLGSLMPLFDPPCGVQMNANSGLGLIFTTMIVQVSTDGSGANQLLRPTTPVNAISLFNRFSSCDQVAASVAASPWKGFVRYTN